MGHGERKEWLGHFSLILCNRISGIVCVCGRALGLLPTLSPWGWYCLLRVIWGQGTQMWPDRFSIPMAMAHPIRVSQMACWNMTEKLLSSSRHSFLKMIHYLLSPNLHYVENGVTMLSLSWNLRVLLDLSLSITLHRIQHWACSFAFSVSVDPFPFWCLPGHYLSWCWFVSHLGNGLGLLKDDPSCLIILQSGD